MRRLFLLSGVLLVLAAPSAVAAAGPPAIDVAFSQTRVSVVVGQRLTLESSVTNKGASPTDPLVAHLNVASLDSRVYVDLEDWSADVTRELDPLAAGGSQSLTWELQAVNAGDFHVYLVVLPKTAEAAGNAGLAASPPVHVQVAGRRTLSAGGALPVIVAVPVLLGLVTVAVQIRARRAPNKDPSKNLNKNR